MFRSPCDSNVLCDMRYKLSMIGGHIAAATTGFVRKAVRSGSHRIIDVDESALDSESLGHMRPQRLNAVALGGMMTGRDIWNAAFAGEMYRLFRDLAADKQIGSGRDGLFE